MHPSDIKDREFPLALRGYSKKEVKEFLRRTAKILEELLKKNKELSEKRVELQRKLDDYQSKKDQLDELLASAQQKANLLIKQSEEKAHLTIGEAEAMAKKIHQEKDKKLESLQIEIEKLSNRKKLFLSKFRTFLHSQVELLKFYEEDTSEDSAGPLPSPIFGSVKKVTFEED